MALEESPIVFSEPGDGVNRSYGGFLPRFDSVQSTIGSVGRLGGVPGGNVVGSGGSMVRSGEGLVQVSFSIDEGATVQAFAGDLGANCGRANNYAMGLQGLGGSFSRPPNQRFSIFSSGCPFSCQKKFILYSKIMFRSLFLLWVLILYRQTYLLQEGRYLVRSSLHLGSLRSSGRKPH